MHKFFNLKIKKLKKKMLKVWVEKNVQFRLIQTESIKNLTHFSNFFNCLLNCIN